MELWMGKTEMITQSMQRRLPVSGHLEGNERIVLKKF
jgi:hypothetical protein